MTKTITQIGLEMAMEQGFVVSAANTILSPGKFEGEHVSTLYFYDCWLNGDCGEWMDETMSGYRLTEEEAKEFDGCPTFLLMFSGAGFVCGDWSPIPLAE